MRIGVSSSGRWWVSMGPLGWLLFGWIILLVMGAWYTLVVLVQLAVLICKAIAEHRAARVTRP
jgi:hypothetical protein